MKICPYCAEEIKKEAIKCKHCGEFLDTSRSDKANSTSFEWCRDCGKPLCGDNSFCNSCGSLQVPADANECMIANSPYGPLRAGPKYGANDHKLSYPSINSKKSNIYHKINGIPFSIQVLLVLIICFFVLEAIKVTGRKSTTSSPTRSTYNSSYSSPPSNNCYSLGYQYGKCATLVLKGQQCSPADDIIIPENCRGKDETVRGIAAGTKSVY